MLRQQKIFFAAFLFIDGPVHQYSAISEHTTAICITRIVKQCQQIFIILGTYCYINTVYATICIISFP